jgi:hypothetical protein
MQGPIAHTREALAILTARGTDQAGRIIGAGLDEILANVVEKEART